MSTSTLTIEAPVLPDLDPAIGTKLADEILLGAAKEYAPSTVKALTGRNSVRAWSLGGNVD